MKPDLKLNIDDLEVSSFVPEGDGMQLNAYTVVVATCRIGGCATGGGGQLCVTKQYGGGETCETGPVYYC